MDETRSNIYWETLTIKIWGENTYSCISVLLLLCPVNIGKIEVLK